MGAEWWSTSASAIGASHLSTGAPNQDSSAILHSEHGIVAAVSDGHGGQRYTRSAIGSALAVDVAVSLGSMVLAQGGDLHTSSTNLAGMLVEGWRTRAHNHFASHPFTADEATLVGSDPLVAYGATLMVVLERNGVVSALQLGDGDIHFAWNDGRVVRALPDDPRNVGGRTTSLCLPEAAASFRHRTLPGEETPHLVMVSTDGYGNSFADSNWAGQVMGDLFSQIRRSGADSVRGGLPLWVAESARVGGDDTTVVILASNLSAAPPVVIPPGVVPPATRAPRSTLAPLIAVGAIAGVLGFGTALLVTSGDAGDDIVPATTQPLDTTTTQLATTTAVATTVAPTTVAPTTSVSPPSSEERALRFAAGSVLVEVGDMTAPVGRIRVTQLPDGARTGTAPVWTAAGEWSLSGLGSIELLSSGGGRRMINQGPVIALGTTAGVVVAVKAFDELNPSAQITILFFDGTTAALIQEVVVVALSPQGRPADQVVPGTDHAATTIGGTT